MNGSPRTEGGAAAEPLPPAAPAAGEPTVVVFYDGACPLCSAEIDFYRRRRGADGVCWLDVSQSTQDEVAPGLTRESALNRFHVRDADGRLISGGAAFVALWSALPGLGWLGSLFRWRPLAVLIDFAYNRFLPWRPALQRWFAGASETRSR
ncbi:MAG: DUF393 domain-containing protein [Rhodospirillales bacterium]|jgi:predicted DCC family thiol-disulfide oxidoreductase YuxK|nr:DUF393 domain-containing protein [Rhodospirillales bacterium]